ncbi:MAG: hypothetical protein DRH34_10570 [Deltaproteobacteria bacterium]|nr:MAG: hypothetical protein DRH34_10570 [Deltaproteobacteria bacterium]
MGDLCDPDIDNDGYDNDRDECDYESVSSSSGLIICPPNHTCRTGCLPDRILEISDFQMKFDINTAQPDPGLHEQPRLTIPLDICDLMPCETIGLFKDEDFINLTVSADLDRTDMPELIKDNPMTLTFSVLNESGVVMAASDLDFLAGDSQSGNLVFQMGPAFTMRETMPQPKGDEPDNALPSYYLSISFQYEYEACTDECVECAECEQQCGGCDDTCGHCDECTECDAVCGPCKVCEAQMRGLYATFFSQNNFEVKTQMAYEQVCGDFDDDGDVDGSDLAYLISSGKECMASFVAVFGQ